MGITANPDQLRRFVEHSIGIATALVPRLGYGKATQVAREALETGQGVYEIVLSSGLMSRDELDELLNPRNMV